MELTRKSYEDDVANFSSYCEHREELQKAEQELVKKKWSHLINKEMDLKEQVGDLEVQYERVCKQCKAAELEMQEMEQELPSDKKVKRHVKELQKKLAEKEREHDEMQVFELSNFIFAGQSYNGTK